MPEEKACRRIPVASTQSSMEGYSKQSGRSVLLRPCPADFAEHAHETNHELMARYQCGTKVLVRWRAETGIIVRNPSEPTPMPDGFALVAQSMTMRELRERYSRSEPVVRRWCQLAGVTPRRVGTKERVQLGLASRAARNFSPVNVSHRDMSRAGQAADFLRRFGPVVRCNSGGRYDPKGDHWRRGCSILAAAEVIERAERLGFDADAWKRVA